MSVHGGIQAIGNGSEYEQWVREHDTPYLRRELARIIAEQIVGNNTEYPIDLEAKTEYGNFTGYEALRSDVFQFVSVMTPDWRVEHGARWHAECEKPSALGWAYEVPAFEAWYEAQRGRL